MSHETALIATVAAGLGLAFLFGLAATRLRLPPLVGYLLAGVAVGPFTPGFVADAGLARQLAEIGVILLLFGVGIHFSPRDLLAVRGIAIPGAAVQIAVATALGATVAHLWGWSWASGIVFGLCLSVASTVVLLRALEDRDMLETRDGRIAVGWLVAEDFATVLVLVLLPALAIPLGGRPQEGAGAGTGAPLIAAIGLTLAKVAAFALLMIVVGRRAVPWLLDRVAHTGNRELFTLSVLAVALGIAVGSAALFGVSFALGAFFAGMVVNGSDLSHEAASDALPLQDAFAVLFFVSVGMLFDPGVLLREPLHVLAVVLIILVGKSLGAALIVLAFRYPIHTALTISASLAQVGEFSFILATLAARLGLLPGEGQSLIVAGALLSITLNPLIFRSIGPLERWLRAHPRLSRALERPGVLSEPPGRAAAPALRDHVVLVGYGRVGSAIGEALSRRRVPHLVVEENREIARAARARGVPVVHGDAGRPGVLERAHVADARLLVIAAPDPFVARAALRIARRANPRIDTIVRTHSEEERAHLEREGVGAAVMGEQELARTMVRYALERCGAP